MDPFQADEITVASFLTNEFNNTSNSYSALNTARSALSSILPTKDGMTVGKQPLIQRLMKGIFRSRPSLPRYTVTYDVQIVLSYLESLPDCVSISLSDLTLRLSTLMCLLSGQRQQTLSLIDVHFISVQDLECTIYINGITKVTRPGFHVKPLVLKAYPANKKLCIVTNLRKYLELTFKLRGPFVQRFISFKPPHKPVTVSTISRWVEKTLKQAGIDTNTFHPHSTRSASCSKAHLKGLSLDEMRKAGGWSNTHTFGLFYNKPVITENFGETVLS